MSVICALSLMALVVAAVGLVALTSRIEKLEDKVRQLESRDG